MTFNNQHLLLAVDDAALPLRQNVCLYLNRPEVRPEPVLTPSDDPLAPDGGGVFFYGTVLHDEGRFRMWYYACAPPQESQTPVDDFLSDTSGMGPICYAESEDGLTWIRPGLGQIRDKLGRDTNGIDLGVLPTEAAAVIRDDLDPDPERRYKLAFSFKRADGLWTFTTAVSADGLVWRTRPGAAVDTFAEISSLYRHGDLYVVTGQAISPWIRSEGGGPRGRQSVAFVSPDFEHWLPESAVGFALPEPADAGARGPTGEYDQVHMGVAGTSFGNVCVGLYCRLQMQPQGDDWWGLGTTAGDLGLAISSDGIAFRDVHADHIYLSREDSPVPAANGTAHQTVLLQGNGILDVADETWIYHGRWRNASDPVYSNYGEVALATIPRHRFGALGLFPDAEFGSFWSEPLAVPTDGCVLRINGDDCEGLQVEVADAGFVRVRGLVGRVLGLGSGLDLVVTWEEGDLGRLANETIRLKFTMVRGSCREPRLYAAYLRSERIDAVA